LSYDLCDTVLGGSAEHVSCVESKKRKLYTRVKKYIYVPPYLTTFKLQIDLSLMFVLSIYNFAPALTLYTGKS